MTNKFPEGKFMTTVKVGPKGQIVIPKEAREMFGLKAGDALLFLADKGQGIATSPSNTPKTFLRKFIRSRKRMKRNERARSYGGFAKNTPNLRWTT